MFCETEANECIPNPCLNGGTCIDELNNFECLCLPGFSGTNCQIETTQCKIMDYHSNCILWDKKLNIYSIIKKGDNTPCQNNGTCIADDLNFICECLPGFTGQICEQSKFCNEGDCKVFWFFRSEKLSLFTFTTSPIKNQMVSEFLFEKQR